MMHSHKMKVYIYLFIGVLIVSTSAVFIRWAAEVAAVVIAFYRLLISASILLIYDKVKHKKSATQDSAVHWHFLVAGFFLALHFITWIASLKLTTIANAIFLGSTHPFFAIIFSIIFLKESPKTRNLPAFILALFGMYLVVAADFGIASKHIAGDVSAIFSALFFALYLMIARMHRHNITIIRYLGIVYGIAAVVCLLIIIPQGEFLYGFSGQSWLMLLLLALGPSLLGHSLLNWASRNIEIFKVNLAMLLEPILATLAGMWLFLEYPKTDFYPGAILIILSMCYLVIMENQKTSSKFQIPNSK